jgi:hypothetical protein
MLIAVAAGRAVLGIIMTLLFDTAHRPPLT